MIGTPPSDAVERYFVDRYPARRSWLAPWFRAGEAERHAVVVPWLRAAAGQHVLDVGTGDGVFLASVLPDRLAALWLVDLSARSLAAAQATLAGRADAVHARSGDVRTLDLPRVDVVVAFGVSDYVADWTALLARLRSLARRMLLVDFPRARTPRALARRLWLWRHRIAIHDAELADVHAATRALGEVDVVATRLHWIARITLPGSAS